MTAKRTASAAALTLRPLPPRKGKPTPTRTKRTARAPRRTRAYRPRGVMQEPDAPKLLLSMDEAAYSLSCGKRRIYDLIAAGELTSFKVGSTRRVPLASLEGYVARRIAEAEGRSDVTNVETTA